MKTNMGINAPVEPIALQEQEVEIQDVRIDDFTFTIFVYEDPNYLNAYVELIAFKPEDNLKKDLDDSEVLNNVIKRLLDQFDINPEFTSFLLNGNGFQDRIRCLKEEIAPAFSEYMDSLVLTNLQGIIKTAFEKTKDHEKNQRIAIAVGNIITSLFSNMQSELGPAQIGQAHKAFTFHGADPEAHRKDNVKTLKTFIMDILSEGDFILQKIKSKSEEEALDTQHELSSLIRFLLAHQSMGPNGFFNHVNRISYLNELLDLFFDGKKGPLLSSQQKYIKHQNDLARQVDQKIQELRNHGYIVLGLNLKKAGFYLGGTGQCPALGPMNIEINGITVHINNLTKLGDILIEIIIASLKQLIPQYFSSES